MYLAPGADRARSAAPATADSRFTQQELPACRPVLTPRMVRPAISRLVNRPRLRLRVAAPARRGAELPHARVAAAR